MRIKGGGLQIPDRLGQRLAGVVVRQRRDTLGGKAQIKDHEDLLVFGQSKCLCQLVGVKKVQPAAVHTGVGGGQHQVRCYNGRILHAGVPLAAGICKNIAAVKGYHKAGRCAVTARRGSVDLGQSLCRLDDINALLLQIFGGRRDPTGRENRVQLCGRKLARTKILQE